MLRLASALAALAALALPGGPATQARANEIRLDLVRGPLLTSSRITGLGGAFVGVGLGIDGVARNPAALANRPETSTDPVDWDLTFDFLFLPGRDIDWDGDGSAPGRFDPSRSTELEFQAFTVGLMLQPGPLGVGLLTGIYGWQSGSLSVNQADTQVGAALALFSGELVIGLAAAISNLTLSDPATPTPISLTGAAPDLGILYRPAGLPYRFGARLRTTARLEPDDGPLLFSLAPVVGVVPWQLALGASFQLTASPRPYNPPHLAPFSPPPDRRYLLVSAELVLTGPSHGASLEELVSARHDSPSSPAPSRPSGRSTSVGLHLGGEGEVVHQRLRARFGTYLEPIRIVGERPLRLHLTGGAELRLFELFFQWKLTLGFDLAPGWERVSIGLGIWN